MPALENNLLIGFLLLFALAVVAGLGCILWKPLLSRAWRYFRIWWERDKIADAEAKRNLACRIQAEAELRQACDLEKDSNAPALPRTVSEPERDEDKHSLQRVQQRP